MSLSQAQEAEKSESKRPALEGLTIQAMDRKLSFALQIAYLIKLKIAQGNNATDNIHSPLAEGLN